MKLIILCSILAFVSCSKGSDDNAQALRARLNSVEKSNADLQVEVRALKEQVTGLVSVTSANALAIDEPHSSNARRARASNQKGKPSGRSVKGAFKIALASLKKCEAPCAKIWQSNSNAAFSDEFMNTALASVQQCASKCKK